MHERVASYIIICDMVGFSEGTIVPSTEKTIVTCEHNTEIYLRNLKNALVIFGDHKYNVFTTGDGAVICLYEKDYKQRKELCKLPLLFAIEMLKLNYLSKDRAFDLRISINYCECDILIENADFGFNNTLQLGDGISICERINLFCEHNEIIVNSTYFLILKEEKVDESRFLAYREVFVKEMKNLCIFSYLPIESEKDYIYTTPSEEKHRKKYAYFPPIETSVYNRIKSLGLDTELKDICDYAYTTLLTINKKLIMDSWGSIYSILKKIPISQEKHVYIISREDMKTDFWDRPEGKAYLDHLERLGEKFNHYRIFIYDSAQRVSTSPEVIDRLKLIHDRNTLKKIDIVHVNNTLRKFRLGITIYPRLRCAIIPGPITESYNEYITNICYTDPYSVYNQYPDIDFVQLPKGKIIADPEVVGDLIECFEDLINNPALENIN